MTTTAGYPKEGATRPPWWKRRYVVNRDLQMRFAWSAVIVGLVSSSVSSFMILLAFWSFNIWQGQRLPVPVTITILVVMVTNVAGIYVVAVLTTQRIAGPLFNLTRQFQELARFNLAARARFRKKDELQYVARRFNDMAESLQKRDEQIYERIKEICTLISETKFNSTQDVLGGPGQRDEVFARNFELIARLASELKDSHLFDSVNGKHFG